MVMELCPQGDVSKLIAARGALDECFSCRLFKQLCLAVQYLHGVNVAHRDIKCENLLLDQHYNLKLCDFGLSEKLTYVNGKVVLSDTHCGTLHYAAPEILKNLPYNPMVSDVWSMGVVLYMMLCGSLPFSTACKTKLVQLQMRHSVIFPTHSSVSAEAAVLIHSILHPVVEHRITVSGMLESPWVLQGIEGDGYEAQSRTASFSQRAPQNKEVKENDQTSNSCSDAQEGPSTAVPR